VFAALAILSAAFYGAADFLGGLTSKRAETLAIVVLSQFTGLVLLAVMVPFLPAASFSRSDVWWGAAAGITGGSGVAILYYALSVGTMAVVAPVTSVCAVVIPVCAAFLLGERPGPLTITGIVVAIVAIMLLSRSESAGDVRARGERAGRKTSSPSAAAAEGVDRLGRAASTTAHRIRVGHERPRGQV